MITADNDNQGLLDNIARYRSHMVKKANHADPQHAEDAAHDAICTALQYYQDKYDAAQDKKGRWLCGLAEKTARQHHKPQTTKRYRVITCPVCGRKVREKSQCLCGLGIPLGLVSDPTPNEEPIVPDCYSEYEDYSRREEHWFLQESLLETVPEWLRDAMFLVYVDRHKTAREVADMLGEDYHALMIQFRGAKRRMQRTARLLQLIQ